MIFQLRREIFSAKSELIATCETARAREEEGRARRQGKGESETPLPKRSLYVTGVSILT